jgi:tRNA/rRNA methyltransferase
MNLPETNTSLFQRLRFVLVHTSRAGNIGSVARAIKTMGFGELVLVAPRCEDPLNDPEAVAFASGADDVGPPARILAAGVDATRAGHPRGGRRHLASSPDPRQ